MRLAGDNPGNERPSRRVIRRAHNSICHLQGVNMRFHPPEKLIMAGHAATKALIVTIVA
jgi:hypothetical protein